MSFFSNLPQSVKTNITSVVRVFATTLVGSLIISVPADKAAWVALALAAAQATWRVVFPTIPVPARSANKTASL